MKNKNKKKERGNTLKLSEAKNYDDLPLFLNAEKLAKVLGVSISSAYELMHEKDFLLSGSESGSLFRAMI